jgi:surfactin synthase thioesterase subunit
MTPTIHSRSAWLRSFRTDATATRRVICFPHAGGGAGFYRSLALSFPDDVDVRVIQYPGRETRVNEPLVDDMDSLVDAASEAVLSMLDRPYAIVGHSMGGSVAYEVTRRLEAAGVRPPVRLVVSARQAPGGQRRTSVHELDEPRFVEVLRDIGGTPLSLLDNREMRDYVLPILRNDYRLIERYRPAPGPRLRTGIVAIAARDDPSVTPDEVAGWSAATDGGFEFVTFPGGHFYLVERGEEFVATVLDRLSWSAEGVAAEG